MSARKKLKRKGDGRTETMSESKHLVAAQDDNIKALVRSALAYYADWFKRVESGPGSPISGVYERFQRFARGAAEDLEVLARQGVGPTVVVCLIFIRVLRRVDAESEKRDRADWRRFSSYNYWKRGRRALGTADAFLSEFAGSFTARHIAKYLGPPEFDPFVKVCRSGIDAASKLRELINVIDELGLSEPGWTLKLEPGGKPLYRKSTVAGRKKSGKGKKDDWGRVAAMLHEYFKRSTGKPHWGAIPRLLHFAGFKDFPELILKEGARGKPNVGEIPERWDYKNKVRARVLAIRQDDIAMYAVEHTVDDYEMMWKDIRPDWWIEMFRE